MSLILVVDDEPLNLELLRQELRDANYQPILAERGAEALERLEKEPVDLVLLDIMMPEMDGLTVLRCIRKTRDAESLPVIMVTARDASEDVVRALNAGANDYITKPLDTIVLLARIRTHLRHKELTASQAQFLGMVSHDIRSLVMKLTGFATLALKDAEPSKPMSQQCFSSLLKIEQHAANMRRLVGDFLDSQAVDEGRIQLHPIPVNASTLINKVIEDSQLYALSKSIQLVAQVNREMPLFLADPHRIEQVMSNLIDNAIKFGFPNTQIRILGFCDEKTVRMEVQDEGPGLTEEDLKKVFHRSQKLSNRPTGGETSYGLGLLICRKIVEQHGGEIFVRNNPVRGATFGFWLPLLEC